MNKFFLQGKRNKNISRKSAYDKSVNFQYSNIESQNKKFNSGIFENLNTFQNINLLFSKNYKSILNLKSNLKKEALDNQKYISNSLSNSNIFLKSTEENLLSSINNKDLPYSNNITNKKRRATIKNKKSLKNKIEGAFLKRNSKFKEEEFIKSGNGKIIQNSSKTRNKANILNCNIIKDIEKGEKKLISEKKRNSVCYNQNKKFIESPKNNRKLRRSLILPSFNLNKINIFPKKQFLQLKSIQDIEKDISKRLSVANIFELKNEIKEHEDIDINKVADISPSSLKKDNRLKSRKSSESTFIQDLSKIKDKIHGLEFEEKYRSLFLSKNLYDSLEDDEFEDIDKEEAYYIAPNSNTCYIIDSLTLISSLITLTYTPFFLSNKLSMCKIDFFSFDYIIYIIIEFVYIADLISGFFRAYYNFDEVLIIKNKKMIFNYLYGWFIIDLIEAIPFFLILNFYQEDCKKENFIKFEFVNLNYTFLLLKIFKIMKIYKNSIVKLIGKFLNKSNFISDWKGVLVNLFIIACSLHLGTCYLIFLGKNIYPGWIIDGGLQSESYSTIYIAGLYYVMTTLTTVGYGDVPVTCNQERIFQIILLLLGTFAYSWLLTYISNYIKKNNEKYIVFEQNLKILEEIKINYPNLSQDLHDRIYRYLIYNKSKYNIDVKKILYYLPSSIQNNLIIEIYKPIIQDFFFFKYFENSDFLVKIVTSMKRSLSMKEDILIQEGDVIEEIIFVKKGVLSLEIEFNLDQPQKYAEDHLRIDKLKSNYITDTSTLITNIQKKNTFSNYISNDTKIKTKNLEPIQFRKKIIKIIEMRKNEHFGDILMILNEKSPVTIKVKSKKAELLFLEKADATEISNLYPNIWKRIVNRSLHNMKQIKNIIKRKIVFFCELNDIPINPMIKNQYLIEKEKNNYFEISKKSVNKNYTKKKSRKIIESIIKEEDESQINSIQISNTITKSKSIKKIKKAESLQYKHLTNKKDKNDSFFNPKKTSSTIVELKNNNKKISDKIFKNEVESSNIINSIFKEKINYENKNNNKVIQKVHKTKIFDISNKNCDIKSENKKSEKINEETYFNEDLGINNINRSILMNNYDKNNSIFHLNNINNSNYFEFNNDNYKNKINKLLSETENSDEKYENILIDNDNSIKTKKGNKKINIYNNIVINNTNKNDTIDNKNYKQINKFFYLENSSIISFTINAIYENINTITNFQYGKNSTLRENVKQFILEKLLIHKRVSSSLDKIQSIGKEIKNHSLINLNKNINDSYNSSDKFKFQKSNILKNHDKLKNLDDSIMPKGTTLLRKKVDKKIKTPTKIEFNEATFYTRIKTIKKNKKSYKSKEKNESDKYNYEERISQNIEKNKQNLNNPQEYFTGFFSKLLTKKNIKV